MKNEVSNTDDLIDSRDVIARLEELRDERQAIADAAEEARGALEEEPEASRHENALQDAEGEIAAWDADNAEELAALESLNDQAEGYSDDWTHGATLVRDSYFEDYARQLADDLGAVSGNETWPHTCIDWERAAQELQSDYTSVEFSGVTYWVR